MLVRSEAELLYELRSKLPRDGDAVVGIDGDSGSGKTKLAVSVCRALNALRLSLDNYLTRRQNAYASCIRIPELRTAFEETLRQTRPLIVEGVCLLQILEMASIALTTHVYIRVEYENGMRRNADICHPTNLLEYRRALRETGMVLPELGEDALDAELQNYHLVYDPENKADIVYARIEG